VTYFAVLTTGISSCFHPSPRLIWNASASVPVGLYHVTPIGGLQLGDLVVVQPPEVLAAFMAERGYLALGVPLLKHIRALPGQTVCRHDGTVTVDGALVAATQQADGRGRDLPRWNGCRVVRDDEVLLMNSAAIDSFDGRYFGLLPSSAIIGRASPIWTGWEP
jgi:conjugative transfer signal peptidase TraF